MSKDEKHYRYIITGTIYKGTTFYTKKLVSELAKLYPEKWEEVIVTAAPKPKTSVVYANIYEGEVGLYMGVSHSSRQIADECQNDYPSRVGCVRIELVEGQFDE